VFVEYYFGNNKNGKNPSCTPESFRQYLNFKAKVHLNFGWAKLFAEKKHSNLRIRLPTS
jgi:hypothetical protein